VSIGFSNLNFTTQPLSDGTLVQVGPGMTFQLSAHGANVSYANGCVTEQYQGRVTHECRSQEIGSVDKIVQMLPASVQPVLERLLSAKPVSYTHLDVYKRQVGNGGALPQELGVGGHPDELGHPRVTGGVLDDRAEPSSGPDRHRALIDKSMRVLDMGRRRDVYKRQSQRR